MNYRRYTVSKNELPATGRDSWDEEDMPRDLPGMDNLMQDSETEFVTLPGGWLQGSGVAPPVREGSKLRVPDTMLFMRPRFRDQIEFMADILENELCGIVYGQPGTGKSSAAYLMAGSLALHREDISILWVNVNRLSKVKYSCVLLEKGKSWKIELPSLASVEEVLKTKWVDSKYKNPTRVLLLDGYLGEDVAMAKAIALQWAMEKASRHRVFFLSFIVGIGHLSREAREMFGAVRFQQTTWTFEDYLKAISNPRFRDSVLRSLSVEPSESHDTQTVTRKLKAKYHYAGGCARFMFRYTTDEVISLIEDTISEIESPEKLAAITTAMADESLKRSLLECFRKRITGYYSALNHHVFISDYVKDLVAKQIGVDNLIQNSILFRNNESMLGLIFEEYFFRRVSIDEAGKKLTLQHPFDTNAETFFHCGLSGSGTIDPSDPDPQKFPVSRWIRPAKYNQGGFDGIFLKPCKEGEKTGRVIFVQCTIAHRPKAQLGYCYEFIQAAKKNSIFVAQAVEFYFIVPKSILHTFTIGDIEGLDTLSGLLVGDTTENDPNLRNARYIRVRGIDGWMSKKLS